MRLFIACHFSKEAQKEMERMREALRRHAEKGSFTRSENFHLTLAFLGETEGKGDTVVELNCNLDDMTGEALGFAMEALLGAGALEVFYTPVQMKKNRPGVWLHCLCKEEEAEKFARLIFQHTTTIGIRRAVYDRYVLNRAERAAASPWGEVRMKVSEGYGVSRAKPEFDDLARIAREKGITVEEVRKEVR